MLALKWQFTIYGDDREFIRILPFGNLFEALLACATCCALAKPEGIPRRDCVPGAVRDVMSAKSLQTADKQSINIILEVIRNSARPPMRNRAIDTSLSFCLAYRCYHFALQTCFKLSRERSHVLSKGFQPYFTRSTVQIQFGTTL